MQMRKASSLRSLMNYHPASPDFSFFRKVMLVSNLKNLKNQDTDRVHECDFWLFSTAYRKLKLENAKNQETVMQKISFFLKKIPFEILRLDWSILAHIFQKARPFGFQKTTPWLRNAGKRKFQQITFQKTFPHQHLAETCSFLASIHLRVGAPDLAEPWGFQLLDWLLEWNVVTLTRSEKQDQT